MGPARIGDGPPAGAAAGGGLRPAPVPVDVLRLPARLSRGGLRSRRRPGWRRWGACEGRGIALCGTWLAWPDRAYCGAGARRPLKNIHGRGGTRLDAAGASMARGASGVGLRAVSRLGLVCRGTVYVLVGFLALRLAFAAHRGTAAPASSAGAVQEAVGPGWGRVTLVLLVAGLAAYALTQLIEAVFRPSRATGAMGAWRQRAVSSWGAGAGHEGAGRVWLPRARRRCGAGRCVRAQGRGAVQRGAGEGAGRDLPFSGRLGGGTWLLALLASGLVCYGLYCLIEARYRDLAPGR